MQRSELVLDFFSDFIEKEIGIVYHKENYFQLNNRLDTIQSLFGYKDLAHLYDEAKKGLPRNVKLNLLDLATNNETSFFRDRKVFEMIKGTVLPQLCEKHQDISIWSVASSTGQECYSTSIMIKEFLESNRLSHKYEIMGTDISQKALDIAKEGSYSQLEVQRGLPGPLLVKYFEKHENNRWQVKPQIKDVVSFKELNLIDPFRLFKEFDLVLCRNVLIYQTKERKIEILKRVDSHLKPGGFLVMGSGETLVGIQEDYEQHIINGAILYQKRTKS